MNYEVPKTLTIDNTEYDVSTFSPGVQNLVTINTHWRNQLVKEKLAVTKTETALRALDAELAQMVNAELAKPSAPDTPVAP